jgi:mannan endo-1,4-beta-mannosidase
LQRTGTGYVGGFDTAEDKITFTIDSDALTLYDVSIRYAGIYGEKRTSLVLNGGTTSEVLLPATDAFADAAGGQLLLDAGSNTIEIVNNWGWFVISVFVCL